MAARERLIKWAKKEEMNTVIVLMPESSRSTKKISSKPYGSYDVPSQVRLDARQIEEIISESAAIGKSTILYIITPGILQIPCFIMLI